MFQDRFADKVRDGSKPHTIRKTARCKVGDTLSLRRWSGKPYRSKQELLRTETCIGVHPVRIENVPGRGFAVVANGYGMTQTEIERLALDDGFDGAEEMAEWFADTHGLPFDGFLIRWSNAAAHVRDRSEAEGT
jgi:hypothetical protein